MLGSSYNVPKAIFYLLKGDYNLSSLRPGACRSKLEDAFRQLGHLRHVQVEFLLRVADTELK